MSLTYRAVQVTEPGKLELVNRPIPETPAGKVRLRVEACGICHTDGGTVYNAFPGLTLPRVPGHEVVGRIDALGRGCQRLENRPTGWRRFPWRPLRGLPVMSSW
jgi:alcohol dehydrogenase, propanol-preferring